MITLFRHQWPGHPGEGGHCRDRHRHRPAPLHCEARGWLRLRGSVARWLRLPRSEEVIKWGLKLTPSDSVMYRNMCTEGELHLQSKLTFSSRDGAAVATTHKLKLPRSAMEFFLASEDLMHDKVSRIFILLNPCFKYCPKWNLYSTLFNWWQYFFYLTTHLMESLSNEAFLFN